MVTSSIRNLVRHLTRELVHIALNIVNMLNHNSYSMYWIKDTKKEKTSKHPRQLAGTFPISSDSGSWSRWVLTRRTRKLITRLSVMSRALTEDALIIRGNSLVSMRHICWFLAIIKGTSFQWLKGSVLSNIKIPDSETFRREIFY